MRLEKPPTAPDLIAGILPLPGRAVPVIDLAKLFGQTSARQKLTAHILVAKPDDRPVAYLVDRMNGILSLSPEDLTDIPENQSLNDCVTAQYVKEGTTTHILDPEKLFSRAEEKAIEQFRAEAEKRRKALALKKEKPSRKKSVK